MKKDLNWFKEQLVDIEMNTPRLGSHDSIWMLDRVNELLNQLDEPEVLSEELPVIPKFVADWTESRKSNYPFDVIGAYLRMNESSANEQTREVLSWIHESELNRGSFARAWLDGYEVKKEQKYVVRTDLGTYLILDMSKREWDYTSIPSQNDDIQYAYKFDDRNTAEGIAKIINGEAEELEQ